MAKFIITGGEKLHGEITIPGAKNAALPMLAAALLTDEPCEFTNVPAITDIVVMLELLKHMGVSVEHDTANNTVRVQRNNFTPTIDPFLAKKLRASILLLGPLVALTESCTLPFPGGCILGKRPLDPHFRVAASFGYDTISYPEHFSVERTKKKYNGSRIFLPEAGVTVTENTLMIASMHEHETIICNAAAEPHVENLAEMLSLMGATIDGAGTNTIIVRGKEKLHGCSVRIIPDQIEAGTWAVAAAITRGDLLIHDVVPEHLDSILLKLREVGVTYDFINTEGHYALHIPERTRNSLKAVNITTNLWPGFPTDMQAPFVVLMTQAHGSSLIHDWMYERRLFYTDKLITMGANITLCDPHRAIVYGPTALKGRELESPDLRAGVALVLAGLVAEGTTIIDHIELVDRGYENLEKRLTTLGANIKRSE